MKVTVRKLERGIKNERRTVRGTKKKMCAGNGSYYNNGNCCINNIHYLIKNDVVKVLII